LSPARPARNIGAMGRAERFDLDLARQRLDEYFALMATDASARAKLDQFWRLVDDGTREEQIRTWQRVRDAGLLPASAAAVLISYHVHGMAEDRCEEMPEMVAIYSCVENDLEPPGLDRNDPQWPSAYWEEKSRRIDDMNRGEMLVAAGIYREFGEVELAAMVEERPDDFYALITEGRAYFDFPPPGLIEECAGGIE
jgi:hypothetical protein